MATVDKNFRIKNGLVVEGSTATVNGNSILTENASDQYILNLIGGETLVKSVDTALNVDGSGKLSINRSVVDTWYDAAGAADAAETAANNYTNSAISTEVTNRNNAISTAKSEAISASETYTDNAISQEVSDRNSAISTAITNLNLSGTYDAKGAATTAENNAKSYTDTKISQEVTDRNNAISSAISTEVSDRNSAISSAIATEVTNRNDAIATALSTAEGYTDTAVANLVDGAPALLNTLNELAAAIADNPNYATDVANLVATKADTTYVDSQDSATDLAAQGYATSAENAAKAYADGLASNYDAAGAASTAQTNANSYTDGQVLNLTDGTNSFQNLNIEDVVAQRAAGNTALPAMLNVVFEWAAADYRSAKILVKAAYGAHTQISELMVTLDTSNNVAVSEYGITYSNGTELAAITADYLNGNVRVLATPASANTDVIVFATLLI